MADNVKVVKAKANGQPASLVGFTKAIYSITEAGEVGERLDNTLENMQSQIDEIAGGGGGGEKAHTK